MHGVRALSRSALILGLMASALAHAAALAWPWVADSGAERPARWMALQPEVVEEPLEHSKAAEAALPGKPVEPVEPAGPVEPGTAASAALLIEPGAPDTPDTSEPEAELKAPGDVATPAPGPRSAELRLDWGDARNAAAVLAAAGMKLVIARESELGPVLTDAVAATGEGWGRRPLELGPGVYSAAARVVDEAGGFGPVRSALRLGPSERLAALVPRELERDWVAQQARAAFERGHTLSEVQRFAGRLSVEGGRCRLRITSVEPWPAVERRSPNPRIPQPLNP